MSLKTELYLSCALLIIGAPEAEAQLSIIGPGVGPGVSSSIADITSGTINGVTIGLSAPATASIVQNSFTYGQLNTAVSASVVTNGNHQAQVNGWASPSGISSIATRGSVGFYADNSAPPLVATVTGSYTTTQFIPSVAMSGAIVANLRVGMFVDTDTNQSLKYSGTITAFDPGGASITVSGWFQNGNTAAGQTPSGTTAYINPTTQIWALNTVSFIKPTSFATSEIGYELDVGDSSTLSATNTQTGMTIVNIGTNTLTDAYYINGSWKYGYVTTQGSGTAFAALSGTNQIFSVAADTGSMEIGGQETATTNAYMDFHSSGGTLDYDSRIIDTGGDGSTVGGGTLTLKGSHILLSATSGPVLSIETSGTFGLVCIAATSDCDSSSHHIVTVGTQANAFSITGAVSGAAVQLAARGTDSNVALAIAAKGTGGIVFQSHLTSASLVGVPTAATCEGTGTITGTDIWMHVLGGGSTSTTCTIQFGNAWAAAPPCLVTEQSGASALGAVSWVITTGSIVITSATTDTAAQFNIACMGTT